MNPLKLSTFDFVPIEDFLLPPNSPYCAKAETTSDILNFSKLFSTCLNRHNKTTTMSKNPSSGSGSASGTGYNVTSSGTNEQVT